MSVNNNLSIKDVSFKLNVSIPRIKNFIEEGVAGVKLKTNKLKSRIFITEEDLKDFLEFREEYNSLKKELAVRGSLLRSQYMNQYKKEISAVRAEFDSKLSELKQKCEQL